MAANYINILIGLKPSGVEWLNQIAAQVGCPRTRVIRAALGVAKAHQDELIKRLEEAL